MKTKMDALVRHPNTREVTTIAELATRGEIEFRKVDNFGKRGGGLRTAYFADIRGTMEGWEISRLAYLSRTGHKIEV